VLESGSFRQCQRQDCKETVVLSWAVGEILTVCSRWLDRAWRLRARLAAQDFGNLDQCNQCCISFSASAALLVAEATVWKQWRQIESKLR
jgi:hypothetical protein